MERDAVLMMGVGPWECGDLSPLITPVSGRRGLSAGPRGPNVRAARACGR